MSLEYSLSTKSTVYVLRVQFMSLEYSLCPKVLFKSQEQSLCLWSTFTPPEYILCLQSPV